MLKNFSSIYALISTAWKPKIEVGIRYLSEGTKEFRLTGEGFLPDTVNGLSIILFKEEI